MLKRIKTVRHGMFGTRPYSIWTGIKRRCNNKNDISYQRYGAKGIKICQEWNDAFMNFWGDMKDTYFDGATIDRIDNNKGYSKDNCRWVTYKEQANNKSNVKLLEYNGKKMNMKDWDNYLKLKPNSVRNRIKNLDWNLEKALSSPKKKYKGYCYDKNRNKYNVEIRHKNKKYFVGRFETITEAKKARINFLHKTLC